MAAQRRVVVFAFIAALVAFCIVQDRVTAAGARRYVTLQRAALAGAGPAVTIDEVMRPAVRTSVHAGLLSAAGTMAAGLVVASAIARRNRRG